MGGVGTLAGRWVWGALGCGAGLGPEGERCLAGWGVEGFGGRCVVSWVRGYRWLAVAAARVQKMLRL